MQLTIPIKSKQNKSKQNKKMCVKLGVQRKAIINCK